MRKTGILGGTFDPIHAGHLILAETAWDACGLDRVLLVPTGKSYFKEDQKVTSAQERFEMTEIAAKDNSHFEASNIETLRPGNTYTYETLEELRRLYPEDEFYYIVGADTLVMMSLWKNPQVIFDDAVILVLTRSDSVTTAELEDEIQKLEKTYGARIQKLPVRNIEISSTDVRNRVNKGQSIRYLVTKEVEQYIRDKGLYL